MIWDPVQQPTLASVNPMSPIVTFRLFAPGIIPLALRASYNSLLASVIKNKLAFFLLLLIKTAPLKQMQNMNRLIFHA